MTKKATKTKEAAQPALFSEAPSTPATKAVAVQTAKPPAKRQGKGGELVKFEPPKRDLLSAIMDAAADPRCDTGKMNALLDIRDRMMREQAQVGFRRAYRAVKADLPRINKDNKIVIEKQGKTIQSTPFASYENLHKVTYPILKRHGLDISLRSEPDPKGPGILMRATLSYIAETLYGECVYSEDSIVPMPPDPTGSKNASQAISSALAYGKRNALILVLDIVTEAPQDRDLDGNNPEKVKKAQAAVAQKEATINAKQVADLREHMEYCGVSTKMIVEKYRIKKLEDLKVEDLQPAIEACTAYRSEAKRREAEQQPRG